MLNRMRKTLVASVVLGSILVACGSFDEVGPEFVEGDAPSARVRVAPCV